MDFFFWKSTFTMLLFISFFSGENPKEWSILELQGVLESSEDELCGNHIGNLHFDDKVFF